MTRAFPRSAVYAFLFTALFYLVCETFISYPVTTFLKPIPIACLIFGVLQSDVIKRVKALILSALGFSMLGDVVLTLPIPLQVELGIACFFLAHCCFIALFLKNYTHSTTHLFYFIPVILYSSLVVYIVLPHLGVMLVPVVVYFVILLTMVFFAFQVGRESFLIGGGAISFLISDTVLSYSMFVQPQVDLSVIIMSTYYVAQLLISLGLVGGLKRQHQHLGFN